MVGLIKPLSKRDNQFKDFTELEIVAHRNGPQGQVRLNFNGALQQVGDWIGEVPTRAAFRTVRGMD